MTRRPSVF